MSLSWTVYGVMHHRSACAIFLIHINVNALTFRKCLEVVTFGHSVRGQSLADDNVVLDKGVR